MEKKYIRDKRYVLDGMGWSTGKESIPACKCEEYTKGKEGGVCGRCGYAILTEEEREKDLDKAYESWNDGVPVKEYKSDMVEGWTEPKKKSWQYWLWNMLDRSFFFKRKRAEADFIDELSSIVRIAMARLDPVEGRLRTKLNDVSFSETDTKLVESLTALIKHRQQQPQEGLWSTIVIEGLEEGSVSKFDLYHPETMGNIDERDPVLKEIVK